MDNNKMIELVNGAPEDGTATHYDTGAYNYLSISDGCVLWQRSDDAWRVSSMTAEYTMKADEIIKLDYSVIEAKTDDKQIPDDAPIHKMLADTGAFIAQGGKPVYTQEVWHGDEWHKCIRLGTDIYGNFAYQIAGGEFKGEFNADNSEGNFRPIKTEQEKLVDKFALKLKSLFYRNDDDETFTSEAVELMKEFSIGESND